MDTRNQTLYVKWFMAANVLESTKERHIIALRNGKRLQVPMGASKKYPDLATEPMNNRANVVVISLRKFKHARSSVAHTKEVSCSPDLSGIFGNFGGSSW